MKKILLLFYLLAGSGLLYAQINPANIPEAVFYPNFPWDKQGLFPVNVNAHSHENLNPGQSNGDVYVFTWDRGITNYNIINAGFAVRQYPGGAQVSNLTPASYMNFKSASTGDFPNQYITSLEAGILKRNDSIFIALTYYSNPGGAPNNGDFHLNTYLWNHTFPNQLQLLNTYNLSNTGNAPKGWIHQDVNNLDSIVITWQQGGRIYAKAGHMTNSDLYLSGKGELALPIPMAQPDITMMRQSNGQVNLYYAMTTANKQQLLVFSGTFAALSSIPPLSIVPLTVTNIYPQTTTGTFGLPRIDAPDNYQYPGQEEVWSVVAAEHVPNFDFISTTSYSNLSGLNTDTLNDGGLVICFNCDLSMPANTNVFNRRPVVAFNQTNLDINYAWVFINKNFYSYWGINSYVSYLSVKTTLGLNLLNNPQDEYFLIPYNNMYDNAVPSVAFSTQNDASIGLFTAFTLGTHNNPIVPYFGYKTADWTTNSGFRPHGNTGILKKEAIKSLSIYPNPFKTSFQIQFKNAGKGKNFNLFIYNLLGQKIFHFSGTIAQINHNLNLVGEQLQLGSYFVKLKNGSGITYQKQIAKW